MRSRHIFGAVLGIVGGALFASSALADIPVLPRDLPPGKTPVPLVVKKDADKDMSFLRISRQLAEQLSAPGANKKADWSPSEPRSIIAALALSAGIAGAFFVRGRKRTAMLAAVLVSGTFIVTSAVQSHGNAAPIRPAPVPPLPIDFQGGVVIEISDRKDFFGVELIVGTKKPPENNRPRPFLPPSAPPEKKT